MNTIKIHRMLMDNREVIIQKDKQNISIMEIAQEYGVHFATIYKLLKKWGREKDSRGRRHFNAIKLPKDQKTEREKKLIAFKERLSPELLAKMKENTRINNKYIKYYKVIETVHEKFLVREILKE